MDERREVESYVGPKTAKEAMRRMLNEVGFTAIAFDIPTMLGQVDSPGIGRISILRETTPDEDSALREFVWKHYGARTAPYSYLVMID